MILCCSSLTHTILYIHEQKEYYLYIHINGRVRTVNARDKTNRAKLSDAFQKAARGCMAWMGDEKKVGGFNKTTCFIAKTRTYAAGNAFGVPKRFYRPYVGILSVARRSFIACLYDLYRWNRPAMVPCSPTTSGYDKLRVRTTQRDKMPPSYSCVQSRTKHLIRSRGVFGGF